MSQQNGSAPQIASLQAVSAQPTPSCGAQQSLSVPPPPSQAAHSAIAASAQSWSHCVSQQNGSAAQIASLHAASSQPTPPCGAQQSLSGPPPPSHTGQSTAAASAQSWSHSVSQQKGSAAQMAAVQSASSQPTVPFGAQQSPSKTGVRQTSQDSLAWTAQLSSHCVSQQNGSAEQIRSVQAASSQPMPSWASQQGIGGPPPQTSQSSIAASAQRPSHCVSQQNGSWAQTTSVQAASPHSGVPLASQQSGGHSPQSASQEPQSSANSLQTPSPHSAVQPQSS